MQKELNNAKILRITQVERLLMKPHLIKTLSKAQIQGRYWVSGFGGFGEVSRIGGIAGAGPEDREIAGEEGGYLNDVSVNGRPVLNKCWKLKNPCSHNHSHIPNHFNRTSGA